MKSQPKKNPRTNIEAPILEVLQYFHFFQYAPTLEQIHMYMPIKVKKSDVKTTLSLMVDEGKLESKKILFDQAKTSIYAMRGEGIFLKNSLSRRKNSAEKIEKLRKMLQILQKVPMINLIGFSGSCTMGNAKKEDDIDIFIITAPNRMWTARFVAVSTAYLLGRKRKRGSRKAPNKACLNMFFDASDLSIPAHKRNIYTAHEVLQMIPVSQVASQKTSLMVPQVTSPMASQLATNMPPGAYEIPNAYLRKELKTHRQFIEANSWVVQYFPNYAYARMGTLQKDATKGQSRQILGDLIEKFLRYIQLFLINRHRTHEIITDTQLWFFPRDFQQKMKDLI